tara:strand:+ start:1039 stop:1224 length:186 start_codon:yes stop_codon:yes gene_type:complete
MAKKKTVKVSDINKEISYEMRMDESMNRLVDISKMLDGRIDLLKERIISAENRLNRLDGGK